MASAGKMGEDAAPPGPLAALPQLPIKVARMGSGRARTGAGDHIRVLVRLRPPLPSQGEQAIAPSLAYGGPRASNGPERRDGRTFDSAQPAVRVTKGQTCFEGEFDAVLPPESSQERVYDEVHDCVRHVLAGKNATVFAYGQTNSGKTYTMLGPSSAGGSSLETVTDDHGIMPRAMAELLSAKAAAEERGETMSIRCTYLQVYNERVLDLLAHDPSTANTPRMRRSSATDPADTDTNLEIRSGAAGVEVVGVTESVVETLRDVARVLSKGWAKRIVRETRFNEASSRSHLLLQVRVSHRAALATAPDDDTPPAAVPAQVVRHSTLSMVDLAGSERWESAANTTPRAASEVGLGFHLNTGARTGTLKID